MHKEFAEDKGDLKPNNPAYLYDGRGVKAQIRQSSALPGNGNPELACGQLPIGATRGASGHQPVMPSCQFHKSEVNLSRRFAKSRQRFACPKMKTHLKYGSLGRLAAGRMEDESSQAPDASTRPRLEGQLL